MESLLNLPCPPLAFTVCKILLAIGTKRPSSVWRHHRGRYLFISLTGLAVTMNGYHLIPRGLLRLEQRLVSRRRGATIGRLEWAKGGAFSVLFCCRSYLPSPPTLFWNVKLGRNRALEYVLPYLLPSLLPLPLSLFSSFSSPPPPRNMIQINTRAPMILGLPPP